MADGRIGGWIQTIADIGAMVNSGVALPTLLDAICHAACLLMRFDFCAIALPDDQREVLRIEGAHGMSVEYIREVNSLNPIRMERRPDQPPSSQAFWSGKPVQIEDITTHSAFSSWSGVAKQQGFTSMVSVPLVADGQVLGTLNSYTSDRHDFTPDMQLLALLAGQAAVSISAARRRAAQASAIQELHDAHAALSAQIELQREAAEIHERLTLGSLEGGGVSTLAETVADLLRTTVCVFMADGRLLHTTTDDPDQIATFGQSIFTGRIRSERGDAIATVETVLPSGDAQVATSTRAAVRLHGETVAWVCVPGDSAKLRLLEVRALEQAATVLALEILRARSASEREWRRSDELLSSLLSGDFIHADALEERSRQLGHGLGDVPHTVIVLGGTELAHKLADHYVAEAAQELGGDQPHRPLIGVHQGHLVALWPATSAPMPLSDRADHIRRACRIAPDVAPAAAVSTVIALRDYRQAFLSARGAVNLALLRGRETETIIVDHSGLEGILLQHQDASRLHRYVQSVLAPVREYDERTNGELLRTLKRLINANLQNSVVAATLFVHKNTVQQRRHRIQSLLNRDLTNIRDLTDVSVALRIDDIFMVRGDEDHGG